MHIFNITLTFMNFEIMQCILCNPLCAENIHLFILLNIQVGTGVIYLYVLLNGLYKQLCT